MEPKQNPFSFYDFLGYFVPGALLLYSIELLYPELEWVRIWRKTISEASNFPKEFLMMVPFILFSYLAGHVLSLISSLTVERFAIWCHEYPSKYLMRLKESNGERHSYFDGTNDNRLRWCYRIIVPLFLLPVSVLEFVFGWFFRGRELYAKPFDSVYRPLLQSKISDILWGRCDFQEAMRLEAELAQERKRSPVTLNPYKDDFFNVAAQFIVAERPEHLRAALNYVALYGFLRTCCLLAVVWFWVPIVRILCMDCFMDHKVALCEVPAHLPWVHLLLISAVAFLLFIGFVKFYRRYSQTILLGLLTIPVKQHMPLNFGTGNPEDRSPTTSS